MKLTDSLYAKKNGFRPFPPDDEDEKEFVIYHYRPEDTSAEGTSGVVASPPKKRRIRAASPQELVEKPSEESALGLNTGFIEETVTQSKEDAETKPSFELVEDPDVSIKVVPEPNMDVHKTQHENVSEEEIVGDKTDTEHLLWFDWKLYTLLQRLLKPKYKHALGIISDQFVEMLSKLYNCVMNQPQHQILLLMEHFAHVMASVGIARTYSQVYQFCREYMPMEFTMKTIPDSVNKLPLPSIALDAPILGAHK